MGKLTFRGGIHPYEGKELAKDHPIEKYLPKGDLVYPLSQHIGAPSVPCVKKGDTVLAGQKIADAGGFVSVPLHASVSGTVKGIEKRLNATGSMVDCIVIENDQQYQETEFQEARLEDLTKEEILMCCENGHELGFRTFVLQGGEDPWFNDDRMVDIIQSIRQGYPDCAITLSIGEKSKESYQKFKEAGADRYLLRHETANEEHYRYLHPENLSSANRKQCLYDLKELGYQIGAGFMVGAPGQTMEYLADDLVFLKDLNPHMVGIGPFVPHHDTKFAEEPAGSVDLTLFLLSVIRIMLPQVLLPATTALGTLDPRGREKGFQAGANVVMPNLSPVKNRKQYELYDNKICTGEEAAECRGCLSRRVESVGYEIVTDRGDSPMVLH